MKKQITRGLRIELDNADISHLVRSVEWAEPLNLDDYGLTGYALPHIPCSAKDCLNVPTHTVESNYGALGVVCDAHYAELQAMLSTPPDGDSREATP